MKLRSKYYVGLGIVFVVAVLQYLPLKDLSFLADDYFLLSTVTENKPHLAKVFTSDWLLTETHEGGYYRPMVIISLFTDLVMWGLRSTGYHITNIVIHALNSVLVFICLTYLIRDHKRSMEIGFIGGLLFAVHPRHIEAIAWVAARTDLLCTLFFLLTVVLYLFYVESHKKALFFISVFCFIAALLSKEMSVTIPFAILILELLCRKEKSFLTQHNIPRLSRLAIFFAALGIYLMARLLFLGSLWGYVLPNQFLGEKFRFFVFDMTPAGILKGVVKATVALCLPAATVADNSLFGLIPRCYSPSLFQYVLAVLVSLIASLGFYLFYKRRIEASLKNGLLVSLAGYGFSLLPVHKAMPLFGHAAERYIYLPSVFFIFAFTIVLSSVFVHRRHFYGLVVFICVIYVASNIVSIRVWLDGAAIAEQLRKEASTMTEGLKRYDRIVMLNVPVEYCSVPLFSSSADMFSSFGSADSIKPKLVDCTCCMFSHDTLTLPIQWKRISGSTFAGQSMNNKVCFSTGYPTIQGADTFLVWYTNALHRGVHVKGHNMLCKIFAKEVEVDLHDVVCSNACYLSVGKGVIQKMFEVEGVKR